MHLALDARFWGLEHTGLGRYTMQLITHLLQQDTDTNYSLIIHPSKTEEIKQLITHRIGTQLYTSPARAYTAAEQWQVAKLVHQINPQLLHVPHFNIPVFSSTPLITTIHDLITLESKGVAATTLPQWQYQFKWQVHKQTIKHAVNKSRAIITPSIYTKGKLLEYFQLDSQKIHITYEAPDKLYFKKSSNPSLKLPPAPYFVYTGNAYPHKNFERLAQALKYLQTDLAQRAHLAIVCGRGVFQQRIQQLTDKYQLQAQIIFYQTISNQQLRLLYQNAIGFITPSLLEGFGLPALEAMAAQTLVLSSDASCLPEIYQQHAIYFDPYSIDSIATTMQRALIIPQETRQELITDAYRHAQTFSWQKMAEQTHQIYQQILQ